MCGVCQNSDPGEEHGNDDHCPPQKGQGSHLATCSAGIGGVVNTVLSIKIVSDVPRRLPSCPPIPPLTSLSCWRAGERTGRTGRTWIWKHLAFWAMPQRKELFPLLLLGLMKTNGDSRKAHTASERLRAHTNPPTWAGAHVPRADHGRKYPAALVCDVSK